MNNSTNIKDSTTANNTTNMKDKNDVNNIEEKFKGKITENSNGGLISNYAANDITKQSNYFLSNFIAIPILFDKESSFPPFYDFKEIILKIITFLRTFLFRR